MKKNIIIVAMAMIIFICLFCFPLFAQQQKQTDDSNPPETIDTYSKILVCTSVFEALGNIGDPQAKYVLTEGLKSKEFFIRAAAVTALGRLHDKETIPLLETLVNDENYLVAISAMRVLFELGKVDMEKSLVNFLDSKESEIRAAALDQIGCFQDRYLPRLHEMLSKDKNIIVRQKIIRQLGGSHFVPAIPLIREALEDENDQVRQAAWEVITQLLGDEAIPLLKDRLNDKDVFVRAIAKRSLASLGEKSLLKPFWKDVEDKDPVVRSSSYVALAKLNDINILPILLKEIVRPENSSFVRREIANALAILKPYITDLVGKNLSKSKTEALSLENLEVSYKINGKSLGLIFTEALKDKNNPLHNDAPFIIMILQEKEAQAALREMLYDSDANMVAGAAHALGRLEDKYAVDDLIKVCQKYSF